MTDPTPGPNAKARAAADADPVGTAEQLAGLSWLADRLDPGSPIREALALAARTGIYAGQTAKHGWRLQVARWAIDELAALPEAPESESGLSLLAAALERVPREVAASKRADPILPRVQAVAVAPEREAALLAFGGIRDGRTPEAGALPLFAEQDRPRVPLLEMADRRGGPIMAKGRGAPLDLRLLVAACVLTPHPARAVRSRLVVTVRELRDFLYPNGWERARHWPAIREALFRARDYAIPGPFEWNGLRLGSWFPFALRSEPGAGASLDDPVLLDIELPPGAASGPAIDRGELARLGVQSAPRFRAYIAAQSVAWIPGRTRTPRGLWVGDPARYPALTAEDRDRLAFGEGDRKNRTRAERAAAWENLPGSVILTKRATDNEGRRGWVIVPEAAAEAVRKREGDNRGEIGRQPGRNRTTTGEKSRR